MTKNKMLKNYWWVGLIVVILYFAGVGKFLGQIIVSKPTVYVGEQTSITFYCGTNLDAIRYCDLTDKVFISYSRSGNPDFVTLGYQYLSSSAGGNYLTINQAFSSSGSWNVQFCVQRDIQYCESVGINVVDKPTPMPPSAPAPQCAPSWICRDATTIAYKNSDCSYSNIETCQFGCDSFTNSCRPMPPQIQPTPTSTPIYVPPATTPRPTPISTPTPQGLTDNDKLAIVSVVILVVVLFWLSRIPKKRKRRKK